MPVRPSIWMRLRRRLAGTSDPHEGSVLLRMLLVLLAMAAGAAVVVGQAAVYQVGEGETLAARGRRQVRDDMVVQGRRGSIFDRSGRNLLAVTVPSPSVGFYGAPYYADRVELAYALAHVLSLNAEDVLKKVIAEDTFAMIKRHVSEEEAGTLNSLALPGVRVFDEPRRFCPMGTVLGSTLGYVGKDGTGMGGLEARYDSILKGGRRTLSVIRDVQRRGFFSDGMSQVWTLDGSDMTLTIDADIQMVLEAELQRKVEEEKALGGMAVVLDPRTGEILAMSSSPQLDPNRFEGACGGDQEKIDDGTNPCRNKVTQYVYEPGSVGKMLTAAVAFDTGKVKLTDLVDGHGGKCSVAGFSISDVHKMGVAPVRDAIKFSSNCAMKDVALRVGADDMFEGLRAFGIGQPTGIDIPGEARGVLRNTDTWGITGTATSGYGYGYSVTLLQLASAAGAIANGGVRMAPHLVREVRTATGEVLWRGEPRVAGRAVSSAAAAQAGEGLAAVVMEDGGTGKSGRPRGYTAAGKTGTARATRTNKGYSFDTFLCSFVGYAPAEDPVVVVAVTVIDPKVNHYGGTVAAPVFRNVVEQTLPKLGVMPSREDVHVVAGN